MVNANSIRHRWRLLRAGPLKLDGGGMFGLIPRPLWTKRVTPDELGRIPLAHNCLLLETIESSETKQPRKILIETGSGNKFDAAARAMYGLTDRSITGALWDADCNPEAVNDVILSHLHFDHAGGVTRLPMEGETPDWKSETFPTGVMLTFPRATIHVQSREWEDALINRSVMTRTYLQENLLPIREQLHLLKSPPPFPKGYLPRRDEEPANPLAAREREIIPGVFGALVPGHTWGQQFVRFTDERDRTVVFAADVMPTVHHIGSAYNLAYDVEPFISTVTRRWFLRAAMENDWLLVLDHEPGIPLWRVRDDGKGWFKLVEEKQES
jgi:glyoxylase-like metal-dependent hydrolase (beta-lactamase superfamily II)